MTDAAWLHHFPRLRDLRDAAARRAVEAAAEVFLRAGDTVFESGAPCSNYLLVIEGRVRVQQLSAGGREIVLYRVGPGESCVLTTACLFSGTRYAAEGVAETDVRAVAIPAPTFRSALNGSEALRRFVFDAYGERLANLLRLLEEIAFERLDVRLAKRLAALGERDHHVATTHQALAVELGSAREVVSRVLKNFSRRGWVRVHRGDVEILDIDALRHLGESG